MKRYKIVFVRNGNIEVTQMEADSLEDARYWFEMCIDHDDIIRVEEVTED